MLQIRLSINDLHVGFFYVDSVEIKDDTYEFGGVTQKVQYVHLNYKGESIFTSMVDKCVYENQYVDKMEYCKNLYLYEN